MVVANEKVSTDNEGFVLDEVGGGLQDGCFESGESLFAKNCRYLGSGGWRTRSEIVEDERKESAVEASEGEFLLENVGWSFDKEGGRKAVLHLQVRERESARRVLIG